MKVQDAIDTTMITLHPSDSIEEALGQLMEYHVRHLPVVADGDLVGILSEEQVMAAPGPDASVGELLAAHPISVSPDAHIFDAAQMMVDHSLSVVPVADDSGRYLGLIRRHDIFDHFAQMLATQEPGAILALEVNPRDYALAQLIHLIEQNDAKVRAVASETPDNSTEDIRVTLKLNVRDTSRVRHVLEHNGYHVVASFGDDDRDVRELADAFMRYLEV
jgi:signal-transduction protein with cAMP-binding, CBS, and nucleotidyltransferase domain